METEGTVKKLIVLLMVFVLGFSSVGAYARENRESKDTEIVYSETEYYDEGLGCTVYEKISVIPNNTRGISGSGSIRKLKRHTWAGGTVMTYYVEGDFEWDDDLDYINVSNYRGDIYGVPPAVTVSNRSIDVEYGTYFFFFNNYVDVSFSFTTTDALWMTNDFSVTLRVSQEGELS